MMASGSAADLARARTMDVTSKEGRAYLEKNLTQWKKILLLDQQDDSKDLASGSSGKKGRKRPASQGSDSNQRAAKKAMLAKASTMEITAKEGKDLIGGRILGDTRQVTKSKRKKGTTKRAGTMMQVIAEANALGIVSSPNSAYSLRNQKTSTKKPIPKKPALKKTGTMQKTAKEAATLLGKQQLGDTREVTKAKQKQKMRSATKTSKKAKK